MKSIVTFAFLLAFLSSQSQMDSMRLYPGAVPGRINNDIKETWVWQKDSILIVSNVQDPILYIFKPAKPNGSSVIICPGGGYFILALDHEGFQLAKWYNERGITAFVLKNRLPDERMMTEKWMRPLQDVQQAFRIVRGQASKWKIDPNKIGLMGFSAGGHLASTGGTHFNNQVGEIKDLTVSVRPDFLVLIYPMTSFRYDSALFNIRDQLCGKNPTEERIDYFSNDKLVNAQTPPSFLISTSDDFVSPLNSIGFYTNSLKHKVPSELHIYEKGGHGYGILKRSRLHLDGWDKELEGWLRDRGLMK